jgi:transcription initiation factor IIE alpha subunit
MKSKICSLHAPIIQRTFDEAYDRSFKCPECDTVLEAQDNSAIIKFIEDLIDKINKESQPTIISIDDP